MTRYALALAAFLGGLAASHYIRPTLACYEPPGAAYIGERPWTPPQATTTCITSGNVTLCQ